MRCLLPTTGVADVATLLIVAGILAVVGVGFLVFHRLRRGGKLGARGTAALALLPIALGALLLTAVPASPAQAATTQCTPVAGGAPGDPGDPGDPGNSTPGSTPTPTPTVTPPPTNPVCTPTVQPDIDFTFANWTTFGPDTLESPALVPASSLPELVFLRSSQGWVPADAQTTITSVNPAGTATAQTVGPSFDNSNGEGFLNLTATLALAGTVGADNDFTVKYVNIFPYDDGCGNQLSATVTYTGFYHVAPAIPQ